MAEKLFFMHIEDEAFEKAKKVLKICSTPHGMHASGGVNGYNSVWSRDSMISLIGASSVDESMEFRRQFEITLSTLKDHQSKSGQLPNCVDLWDSRRKKKATYATLDSTLWYLLGLKAYENAYNEKIPGHNKAVERAFRWLEAMDTGEDGLPEQLPTSDWQDCFPHKYGHTINTVALYYGCLKAYGMKNKAQTVRKQALDSDSLVCMFNREKGYFYPWRWKNHDGDMEFEDWFDSLGNMLAICTGLADEGMTRSILNFVETRKIDRPYPIRVIYPPIKEGSKEWHSYFNKCIAKNPHWYINGGIWPYVGGFYVAALVKAGSIEKSRSELVRLAEANKLGIRHNWEFNEWVHPERRKAMGSDYQAWSAGAYLFACKAVADGKLPLFG